MDDVQRVRVAGPLEPYAAGFAAELTRLGYTLFSARLQLGLAAHLSRWLAEAGLDTAALTSEVVAAFVSARGAAGYSAYLTPKALGPLLGYLRGLGVAPQLVIAEPGTAVERLLERYRSYLVTERGLEIKVARGYVGAVRPFVASWVGVDGAVVGQPSAGDVTAFLVAESGRLAPKTVARVASALRSLLRWWHLEGLIAGPLDEAVPRVADRRAALPRPLEPAHVHALLASCDRGSVAGLRDYAMLMLLARMGLRASEVAGLQLGEINWRCGEITLRGKPHRRDRLPLPVDVGQCVVDYLRAGRPGTALDRCVFIRIKAPHRGLSSTGVTQAVAAAGKRAGLGTIYAHRLRHAAASSMLAHGASLAEVGQVLRHCRAQTTAAYAKVDTEALRVLARPWPAGLS